MNNDSFSFEPPNEDGFQSVLLNMQDWGKGSTGDRDGPIELSTGLRA